MLNQMMSFTNMDPRQFLGCTRAFKKSFACFWLCYFNGKANFKVDHIELSVCIDHGKGHSCVSLTLVVHHRTATGEWSEQQHVFSVANAECRKDNSKIVCNTFGPSLNAELDAIKQSGHVSLFTAPATEAFRNCYDVFGTELARRENEDIFLLT
jgi:hypothetical protein